MCASPASIRSRPWVARSGARLPGNLTPALFRRLGPCARGSIEQQVAEQVRSLTVGPVTLRTRHAQVRLRIGSPGLLGPTCPSLFGPSMKLYRISCHGQFASPPSASSLVTAAEQQARRRCVGQRAGASPRSGRGDLISRERWAARNTSKPPSSAPALNGRGRMPVHFRCRRFHRWRSSSTGTMT